MLYFRSDYVEGCHPAILEKMVETNMEQWPGYGADKYCDSAIQKIKKACGTPKADVHLVVGGTQANLLCISACLRPHQGVISADVGHIACHEAGAIEATGHKVITLPSGDGLIRAEQIEALLKADREDPIREFTVQPAMVYISFPTENGTLYTKQQLTDISKVCKKYDIPLFLDGARLGYGVTSKYNDLTLEDIAALCDIFYIGGTKCGMLLGEAIVITNDSLKKDFRYQLKQKGAMLAKGRVLGIQFDVMFENNLYFEVCRTAVEYALRIREAFREKGVPMWGNALANQQFAILTDAQIQHLKEKYDFEFWGMYDEVRSIVRFCTSWATQEASVVALVKDIREM